MVRSRTPYRVPPPGGGPVQNSNANAPATLCSVPRRASMFAAAMKAGGRPLKHYQLLQFFLEDVRAGHLVIGGMGLPKKPEKVGAFRVLQWNVNSFGGPDWGGRNYAAEVAEIVLKIDADVLVLNEVASNDFAGFSNCLSEAGFTICNEDSYYPTILAVRGMLELQMEKFFLDEIRGAVCGHLRLPAGQAVTVYATHFNHQDHGGVRLAEAKALLHHWQGSRTPTIIAADFNQQRRRDYSEAEWDVLARGMAERGEPEDDGVLGLFEAHGFTCSLDMGTNADRNWPQGSLPPPTHWTGTAIDYAYAFAVQLIGNYVVQTVASDHLPVVSDWVVPQK